VSHAKDLNTALNDIRIVTGYSTDEMAKFAATAREAASALNTTTTEYSKAALIFYQQGLKGDAVKERTDVVVKLANVTH
jgi:tRNA C32,U32 (ribose-2'-O)-methylase TrmJ